MRPPVMCCMMMPLNLWQRVSVSSIMRSPGLRLASASPSSSRPARRDMVSRQFRSRLQVDSRWFRDAMICCSISSRLIAWPYCPGGDAIWWWVYGGCPPRCSRSRLGPAPGLSRLALSPALGPLARAALPFWRAACAAPGGPSPRPSSLTLASPPSALAFPASPSLNDCPISRRSACICSADFWPSSRPMPRAMASSQSFGKPNSSSPMSPRPRPSSNVLRFFCMPSLLPAFPSFRSSIRLLCSSASSWSRLRSRSFSRSNSSFSCCSLRCARSACASFSCNSTSFCFSLSSVFAFFSFLCISNFFLASLRLKPPSSAMSALRPPSYFSSG
mmetsp:Transcript_3546/g.8949  ORF Transcript_3546/g.8949 Transcript_3546/m.8949 type:complete len:331 (+) Transcript_3546:90-1082(+)